MKQLLLHGAGLASSRNKLTSLKEGFEANNVVVFESTSNVTDVLGEISTLPLITEERLIIWENPPKDINFPKAENPNLTLIYWFDVEIDTKNYSNAQIFFFPEEKEASVFPLLDLLGNRNRSAFLELEKRNRTSPNDTQYILTMVFYLLRSLVMTPKKASDFVKRKNETMRKNFSKEEVINLYKKVLEIDFKIKQGLLDIPQAEFTLVSQFMTS